jgi:hypothetical protein
MNRRYEYRQTSQRANLLPAWLGTSAETSASRRISGRFARFGGNAVAGNRRATHVARLAAPAMVITMLYLCAPAAAAPSEQPTPSGTATSTPAPAPALPISINLLGIKLQITLPLNLPGLLGGATRTPTPTPSSSGVRPPSSPPPPKPPSSRPVHTNPAPATRTPAATSHTAAPAHGIGGVSTRSHRHPAPSPSRTKHPAKGGGGPIAVARELLRDPGPAAFIALVIACALGVALVVRASMRRGQHLD